MGCTCTSNLLEQKTKAPRIRKYMKDRCRKSVYMQENQSVLEQIAFAQAGMVGLYSNGLIKSKQPALFHGEFHSRQSYEPRPDPDNDLFYRPYQRPCKIVLTKIGLVTVSH